MDNCPGRKRNILAPTIYREHVITWNRSYSSIQRIARKLLKPYKSRRVPAKHKKNRTGAVNTIVEHGKPAGVVVNESRADHLISGICEQIGLEYRYLPDDPLEIDEIVLDMAKEFLPGKRG